MASKNLDYIRLIRPHQWAKNLLVMAAPAFAGFFFSSLEMVVTMVLAFFAFSLAASSGYVLNDFIDIESDSKHPTKKDRPLPSGRIGKPAALSLMFILLAASLLLSARFGVVFVSIVIAYLVLDLAYSSWLKHIVIIDAFAIAFGFILRIAAGGAASGVEISSWLFLTTLLLALLLAFGKRRFELTTSPNSEDFRKVLTYYPKKFLDTSIGIFSSASIIIYAIYAVERGPKLFLVTIPFVCFGVLRYLYLVERNESGDPTDALLTDKWLFGSVFLWIVLTGLIIYVPKFFSFVP